MNAEQFKQILDTLNNVSSHSLDLYAQKAFIEAVVGTSVGTVLAAIAVFCVYLASQLDGYRREGPIVGSIVCGVISLLCIGFSITGIFAPEAQGLHDLLKVFL